jgi:hypothetical protein
MTINLDELSNECPRKVLKDKEKPNKSWYEAYQYEGKTYIYREDRYGSGPVTTLIATLNLSGNVKVNENELVQDD